MITVIENQTTVLRKVLKSRRDLLQAVGQKWTQFQDHQQDLATKLLGAQEAIQKAALNTDRCEHVARAAASIAQLWEKHQATQADKERLHEEGRQLIVEDQANASQIQVSSSSCCYSVRILLRADKMKMKG